MGTAERRAVQANRLTVLIFRRCTHSQSPIGRVFLAPTSRPPATLSNIRCGIAPSRHHHPRQTCRKQVYLYANHLRTGAARNRHHEEAGAPKRCPARRGDRCPPGSLPVHGDGIRRARSGHVLRRPGNGPLRVLSERSVQQCHPIT